MGFGDVTLMAVVGAAVGPTRSLLVLFIGAALGAFAFIGVVYPVVKLRGAPRGDQIDLGLEAPRAELPEVPFGVFPPGPSGHLGAGVGRDVDRLVLLPIPGDVMDEGDLGRRVTGALGRYTRDLTRDAREGRLEPVRCRDEEVARVIDILLRHGKNNPALVGPAGVGKTAIAEALAQRLAGGDVPLVLRTTRLLALDHVALLAGTAYRGQYEERIRALVHETSADPDVVLFVDELHNLIGQGTSIGGAMDAANMLKPSLVRGDFRVIGATTGEEYDRWICGDPALERRFQRVLVRELSTEETLDVLRARLERLERHHNVVIADDAVRASVELTDVHMLDRRRPDRAIDVLDEACAHTQAVTRYTARAEAMILRRRELLRQRPVRGRGSERPVEPPRRESGGSDDDGSLGSDGLETFARDGLSALQRFGAELESIFTATPVGAPDRVAPRPAPAPADVGQRPAPAPPAAAPSLAVLEVELRSLLIEDGVVVRGLDVARVVALATGHTVRWSE
ncbi:MAG: AAA family ATPase [Gemmatimonadetes bacterium]|nr:AAA family ATPase [Gemmatimonadota bacterium]